MSSAERAVSAFLVFHLAAVVTSALARPPEERVRSEAAPSPQGVLARAVTPALENVAAVERRTADLVWRISAPWRAVTTFYTHSFGLGQKWAMFSNIPTTAEYLRLTFVIQGPTAAPRTRIVHQLIYPAWRLDQFRGVEGFRASYRNKAIEQALISFRKAQISSSADAELGPIVRVYRRDVEATVLQPGERVVRTEVWHGEAPERPFGEPADEAAEAKRASTLDQYLEGPVTCLTCGPQRPPTGATSQEADIVWALWYADPSS